MFNYLSESIAVKICSFVLIAISVELILNTNQIEAISETNLIFSEENYDNGLVQEPLKVLIIKY